MSSRVIRLVAAAACPAAAFFLAAPAEAEVFVVLGPQGEYVETRVTGGPNAQDAWKPVGASEAYWLTLNPEGAVRGDSRPVIAHDAMSGLPIVAWSTPAGKRDRDIVVAKFDGSDWGRLPAIPGGLGLHDSDPAIVSNLSGTSVAWTRKDPVDGKSVWMATFDGQTWSDPFRVTPAGITAWSPSLFDNGGSLIVASLTRGEPRIRFDTFSVVGTMIGESPMPTPPTVSPGPGFTPPKEPPKMPGGPGSAGGEGPSEDQDFSQNP